MGLRLGFRGSSSCYDKVVYVQTPAPSGPVEGNPNPANFKVTKAEQVGKHVLMEVLYPDCKNYEGRKILVYKGTTLHKLFKQSTLDPHFSNNKKFLSPFARFEPSDEGWYHAKKLCESM